MLEGLSYPARRWQLCAQTDAYGADSATREVLAQLPVTAYASVEAVLAELRSRTPIAEPGIGTCPVCRLEDVGHGCPCGDSAW